MHKFVVRNRCKQWL